MLWTFDNDMLIVFNISDRCYETLESYDKRFSGKVTFMFTSKRDIERFFNVSTRMYEIAIPIKFATDGGNSIVGSKRIPDEFDGGWVFQIETLFDVTYPELMLEPDFCGWTLEQITASRS